MATKRIGKNLGSLASVDSSLSIATGSAWVNGASVDHAEPGGAGTPDADTAIDQFGVTNAASTDGYDLDVIRQWSDDNSTWPDDGEGDVVTNFSNSTGGADLTRSDIMEFAIKARYSRCQYANNNGTDAVTVNRESGDHTGDYET